MNDDSSRFVFSSTANTAAWSGGFVNDKRVR
jgi:hypothetical protein